MGEGLVAKRLSDRRHSLRIVNRMLPAKGLSLDCWVRPEPRASQADHAAAIEHVGGKAPHAAVDPATGGRGTICSVAASPADCSGTAPSRRHTGSTPGNRSAITPSHKRPMSRSPFEAHALYPGERVVNARWLDDVLR